MPFPSHTHTPSTDSGNKSGHYKNSYLKNYRKLNKKSYFCLFGIVPSSFGVYCFSCFNFCHCHLIKITWCYNEQQKNLHVFALHLRLYSESTKTNNNNNNIAWAQRDPYTFFDTFQVISGVLECDGYAWRYPTYNGLFDHFERANTKKSKIQIRGKTAIYKAAWCACCVTSVFVWMWFKVELFVFSLETRASFSLFKSIWTDFKWIQIHTHTQPITRLRWALGFECIQMKIKNECNDHENMLPIAKSFWGSLAFECNLTWILKSRLAT